MSNIMYKPFGTVITKTTNTVDFSTDAGFHYKDKNSEGMMDIFNSAVGDFTERPLQIMIREIAKNFLIFTPIGWLVLLFIIGRKYKGKLSDMFKNLNFALCDIVNSLSSTKPTHTQNIELQENEEEESVAQEQQEPITEIASEVKSNN